MTEDTTDLDDDGLHAAVRSFLGDPLPEPEATRWLSMDRAWRTRAVRRMRTLQDLQDGGIDVSTAARTLGLSVTRVYEMGKDWRTRRSLAVVGAFASAPKTRVSNHDATIRKLLPVVVGASRASVRALALDLERALVAEGIGEPPSHNTLRRYVEDELRRREREASPGNEVRLDLSACILKPSDATTFTLFVVLDRATQLVLGAALGDPRDSVAGYAAAARDALRRLAAPPLSGLRWLPAMERAQVVVGLDDDRWLDARARFSDEEVSRAVEPVTAPGRFGRYLRATTGLRLGTVVMMPNRTRALGGGGVDPRPVDPTADQIARLAVEVDEYNAARAGPPVADPAPPPPNLLRMLESVARG